MKTDGKVPQMTYLHLHFCGYCISCHYMKDVSTRSFSSPYFTAFRMNTETYFTSLRIQSNCGKIRIRKTSNTETFHAVCVSTCASVHYSIPVYTLTTLKVIERNKQQILLDKRGSVNRQKVWEYYSTIFWVVSTWFLNARLGEEALTSPLYPSCLSTSYKKNYSSRTQYCKVKIYEKYALGSFIFGRFTITTCNLAANKLLTR